jgi:hypothetical protein
MLFVWKSTALYTALYSKTSTVTSCLCLPWHSGEVSSLPSPQSSSPSHIHVRGMQRSFLHRNWRREHASETKECSWMSFNKKDTSYKDDITVITSILDGQGGGGPQEIFLCSKTSRPAAGSIQPPSQLANGVSTHPTPTPWGKATGM